jgi:hypothetical protein
LQEAAPATVSDLDAQELSYHVPDGKAHPIFVGQLDYLVLDHAISRPHIQ